MCASRKIRRCARGTPWLSTKRLHYHNASPATWAEQLRSLAARPDSVVLPGHGPIYPYSYVGEVAQFIDAVNRAAKNCFAKIGAEEIAASVWTK